MTQSRRILEVIHDPEVPQALYDRLGKLAVDEFTGNVVLNLKDGRFMSIKTEQYERLSE